MTDILPEAVRKGLEEARVAMLRRASRLCVHDGERVHRVLRLWDGGFALAADGAPPLRGFVDLYDGPRHLNQCLVVQSREEGGERVYEYKWNTAVADRPAADFVRAEEPPAALIPRLL
ncbi:hypothetical protein [Wenxinia marina]|uniref:Uncharacterized protein n=1 Tax=Wenxinia marina DSM 24838 TaxID=1123501 RepID=A0A0D0Q4P1_9RHOB|nr:hypothetical protein [Wenxinia marina]KIQ67522.1 hypothetical protein Wenmar_03947 [Wenxinia marina DSM 24838]GGL68831.1 hypothetical protein GCM10011392_24110 [Wenxinia marina]